jgi:transposase-like protein
MATASAPIDDSFPREVIAVAVRCYLYYGLFYRDVDELPTERGIPLDHSGGSARIALPSTESSNCRILAR